MHIQSLVPPELEKATPEEFLKKISQHDPAMNQKLEQARQAGKVLRYTGTIDQGGKAQVSLQSYPQDHAFARISGSDNIVAFKTKRYEKQPLYIQGPGAGPEVTAAGVFADLLRLASYLGAPL